MKYKLDFYEIESGEHIFTFSETKYFHNFDAAKNWVWEWLATSNQWKNRNFRIDIIPTPETFEIYYYAGQE